MTKFRKRIVELEAQRVEIQLAIEGLKTALTAIESRLGEVRPDLLQSALSAVPTPSPGDKPDAVQGADH